MKDSVGKGAIVLIISGLLCKIIGALFRLPLTNIIGIQEIGIFQMIMSIYSLLLVFVSSGVTVSLAKLVSSARASGQNQKINPFLRQALLFSLSISLLIGVIFFFFAKQIASFQGISSGYQSYLLLILLLPLGALIGVFRGIIQGYENMLPTAVSQMIEQTVKFAFGLLFAFIFARQGYLSGVFGAFLGIMFSEILASFYLFLCMKKFSGDKARQNVKKEFYNAVLPLSFSGAIIPLSNAIEALIILSLLSRAGIDKNVGAMLYGLQSGVVGAVLHFPLIISLALAAALLPKISYLNQIGDIEGQRDLIQRAFFAMWFFLLPLTLGITALSKEVFPIIYPNLLNGYLDVVANLTLLGSFAVVLAAVQQFFLSLLQAKGYFGRSMIFSLIGAIVKLGFVFIFAQNPVINIYALPISNVLLSGIISICCLIKLKDVCKIEFVRLTLPLLASFVMFLSVRLIVLYLGGIFGIIISIFLGASIYFLLCLPLTITFFKEIVAKFKTKRRNVC